MKSESKQISIADWRNLTQDTESAVDKALRHLKERQAADAKEAKQIENWKKRLKEHYVVIKDISSGYKRGVFAEAKPEKEQKFIILNDRVRRANEQIRYLPKQDFGEAETTLKDLFTHTKMFISAGPHGPVRPPLPKPTGPGTGGVRKPGPEKRTR
jgi:hypothetical protein